MDFFIEKLKKAKNEVRLDPRKKAEVKAHLSRIIEADKSVRDVVLARQNISKTSNKINLNHKIMPIYAVIAIMVILGGGTTVAAENSLPGDTLYALKVSFNEEVRAAFTFGAESKADWEIQRAERRLEEAAELSKKGRLDADSRVEIEEDFKTHAERVSSRIEVMEKEGDVQAAADTASKFETSLKVHQGVLTSLSAQGEASQGVQSLETAVNTALNTAVDTRTNIETKIGSGDDQTEIRIAAESQIRNASSIVSTVRTYIESQKTKLSAAAYAEADAQIKIAENILIEARTKLAAEVFGESYALSSQAIRKAQEIKLATETNLKLNLDTWVSITSDGVVTTGGSNVSGSNNEGESGANPGSTGVEGSIETETEVDLNINL